MCVRWLKVFNIHKKTSVATGRSYLNQLIITFEINCRQYLSFEIRADRYGKWARFPREFARRSPRFRESASRSLSPSVRTVNRISLNLPLSSRSIFIGARRKDDRRGLPNIRITRSATPCPSPSPISRYVSPILRRPTASYTIDFRRRYHVTWRKDAGVSDSMTSPFR